MGSWRPCCCSPWVRALAAHLGDDYVVRVWLGTKPTAGLPMALVPSAPFLFM